MKRRLFGFVLVLLAAVSLLQACATEEEMLKGGLDEFCNGRDDDCREGLVCLEGVCSTGEDPPVYTCAEMCAKLDTCDAMETNCLPDCRTTLTGWSQVAKDSFAVCVVEDVTCEEAQTEFVPQLCYSRIPLPTDRKDRCDEFASTVRGCDNTADTEELLQNCYALGRTGTAEAWSATDRCTNAVSTGICSGIGTCLNDVFSLTLSLTDDRPLNNPVDFGDDIAPGEGR